MPTVPRGLFSSSRRGSSSSRPGSSQSHKLFSRKSRFFPYGSGQDGALSMANLPRPADTDASLMPSPAFLRPATSNPNLNSQWKGSSAIDLTSSSRPRVPLPSLDVLAATRTGSVSAFTSPKSPLGAYELTLNLPSEGVSSFGNCYEILQPPEPLHIKKQTLDPSQLLEQKLRADKPPSPSVSVRTPAANSASRPEQTLRAGEDTSVRPLGRADSNQTFGSRKGIESPIDPIPFDPSPLPTPPLSVARTSDDRPSTSSSNQWGEPVIQNVRGKRDTMVVKPTRRMSFEKYIEDFSKGILPISSEQSPPQIPRMSSKRVERPPRLNLNVRHDLVIPPAPRSAPLGLSQRPLLAQADAARRTAMAAPPLSAGGPYRDPARPDTRTFPRHPVDEYGCFPYEDADELDDENRPPTPDSPLLPLSGPLASPLTTPDVEEVPEDPLERMRNFRFPAIPPSSKTLAPKYQSSPPLKESFQAADWPLPSPVQAQPSRAPGPLQSSNAQLDNQKHSLSRPWTPREDDAPMSVHESPESLDSFAVYPPHIASQTAAGAPRPVVDGFDSKGGGFF